MRVTLDIPADRIANMMISAMESGDPVTTAARGGWCSAINLIKGARPIGAWYADAALWDKTFVIEVVEVDDETTGHETKHRVDPAAMCKGLQVMAEKFGHLFAQIMRDDTDAPCADIFLQCILFGEEKYA